MRSMRLPSRSRRRLRPTSTCVLWVKTSWRQSWCCQGVIPTGTELVPIGTEPKPGDIVEFNSLMLGAMIAEWGGTATRWPSIPDDYERLKQTILAAVAASDIVVVNA